MKALAEPKALEVLLATASKPSGAPHSYVTEEDQLKVNLNEINNRLAQLRGINKANLLPFEAQAILREASKKADLLETQKTDLVVRLSNISKSKQAEVLMHEMHIRIAEAGYPDQLDLTPLGMARNTGPAFLVTPFNSNGKCTITVNMDSDFGYRATVSPKVPEAIADLLQIGTKQLAQRKAQQHKKVVISARFGGYAGENTAKILTAVRQAQAKKIFDNILVIAEVPQWDVEEEVLLDRDPLIVGWVERTKQMFYITNYDMSPLETYFREQFGYGVTIPSKDNKKKR